MRLGQLLVASGHLTQDNIKEALEFQTQFNGLFGQACLKLGFVSEDDLLFALSNQLNLPIIDRTRIPDSALVRRAISDLNLTLAFCRRYSALVWKEDIAVNSDQEASSHNSETAPKETILYVLGRHPIEQALQEEVEKNFSGRIVYMLGPNRMIEAVIDSLVQQSSSEQEDGGAGLARLRQLAEEAPVIEFVNGIFSDALELGASDVHIEPEDLRFRTRFRIDGVLGGEQIHPKQTFDAVSTRIKILSHMDIAERRLPQDGRQGIRVAGQEVDLRVSTLPGAYGESIVIRLLRKKSALPNIQGLGLEGDQLESFTSIISEPNGIVLVTGPTGSGKSTTLYRVLEQMNNGERKIITIEDPIEYEVAGVTQVHARADIGLTFAAGLRSMLRQDPDVIMVGEIRDAETALISTQAALTGHLVLSTLHTNTAFGSIERLMDLGIESFLIEASLKGVIGQRLVRRLCSECSVDVSDAEISPKLAQLTSSLFQERNVTHAPVWKKATGCSKCNDTGYSGRIGVFEVLDFRRYRHIALASDVGQDEKAELLRKAGFRTMKEDGIYRAALGQTSVKEIERVFGSL